MIWFLLWILLFFVLTFLYYFVKYMNPWKLIMIFGKKGSGKTTYMAKLAYKYTKKGRPVFANVDIPCTYRFDDKDIGYFSFPENSVILIDEVGMIWDNRNFKNFDSSVRDYFKLQRHYKHTVYLFSQSFDIDKKLRDLTDQMYTIQNFFNCLTVLRRVNKKIVVVPASANNGESKISDEYEFESLFFFWCGSIQFLWLPAWSGLFNSYECRQLPAKDFVKVGGQIAKHNFLYRVRDFSHRFIQYLHGDTQTSTFSFVSNTWRVVSSKLLRLRKRDGRRL